MTDMANRDIFGIERRRERRDATSVASRPMESLPDAHEGESAVPRMTRTLEKRVVDTPFGKFERRLERVARKDAEAVEPPSEMPNNAVDEPRKKKREEE